jgi:polyphosphate kinase
MSTKVDLSDKKYYINRELSWLEFNQRCLDEANNVENPVLERVKFLAICYNNLNEFLMIRMPGIISNTPSLAQTAPDYIQADKNLVMVSERMNRLYADYEVCWKNLRKLLAKEKIHIRKMEELSKDQQECIRKYYKERVHILLTPLALDISHPFPFISNNSLNVAFRMKGEENGVVYARVKVPDTLDRFVRVPGGKSKCEYVLIEDIIKDSGHLLFPGMTILGAYSFCIIRNADVKITIDEACDLMDAVEESINGRDMGYPVAMIVDSSMPKNMRAKFLKNLSLSEEQVISTKDAISLSSLWQLYGLDRPSLKEKPLIQSTPIDLQEDGDIFEWIKKRDRILYHPYESFGNIVRFMRQSATDPNVQSIKICLYRLGTDPSIFDALKTARMNGKSVSVLMELRAKFDEDRNIRWAKDLEAIGVHVVYGPVNLKVHSKLLQVVRLENGHLVTYTHMSSGNYNVSTAKQYGDISFLTVNKEIGEDVSELFNALTGYYGVRKYRHLLVAPATLKKSLIKKIDNEIKMHEAHGNGHIMMKANGLVDQDIIAELYKASIAGVKVDLNIRGLCCLRPGIPDVSKNIRVISIVDRFLEHSRIYYFHNNGDPEMYMGSSDMMPRNLLARIEVLFPVLDKELMKSIKENILDIHFADNVKAKELREDGTYVPVKKEGKPLRSQQWFIEHNGCWQLK